MEKLNDQCIYAKCGSAILRKPLILTVENAGALAFSLMTWFVRFANHCIRWLLFFLCIPIFNYFIFFLMKNLLYLLLVRQATRSVKTKEMDNFNLFLYLLFGITSWTCVQHVFWILGTKKVWRQYSSMHYIQYKPVEI